MHSFEAFRRIPHAVKHFIDCAITSRCDNDFKTFADRFGREPAGIAGTGCGFERALAGDLIQMAAETPRLITASRRVENDASAHGDNFITDFQRVEEERRDGSIYHFENHEDEPPEQRARREINDVMLFRIETTHGD